MALPNLKGNFMYLDAIDYYADESFLESEMKNRKQLALNKLSNIVCPKLVVEFTRILLYSWQENLPESEIISNELNLYPIDFYAILDDEYNFRMLLKEEKENYFYGN
jgi:hypothetical protein